MHGDELQAVEALSCDEEMCARIIRSNLHSDVLSYLRWETLSAATLNDPQSVEQRLFVSRLLSILRNVVRNSAAGRTACSRCLDILHKFSTVTAYPVNFFC